MSLDAGTRLGPYEILQSIGAGGMGEVYRARDTRLQRNLAIKVLPALAGADADRVSRFEREAMAVSALNHPNILHIYDIGESSGVHYIAMELVEGATLRRRMREGIERHEAIGWTAQTADALAKAHAAGIVHRDLKPENIMLTSEGYVKVVDFGLAKLVEAQPRGFDAHTMTSDGVSLPGMVLGTVGYMSPEQAQGLSVDHRSDIFSLGCVLHEMLSGAAPFAGKSPLDTQHRLVYGEADPLPPAVEPALRQIVERCLVREPARRYAAARELAADLRALDASNTRTAKTAPPAGPRSIAVLPFADLSAGRDNAYLGSGVAEEVITDLSSIDGLQVVGRASAASFAGTEQPIAAIASALGVEYIVTGSVRRAGDRLRISAQLVHASRDLTLWAQKFDGTMEDIFDIQETVARAIAGQLRLQLSSSASGRMKARPIENIRAYECYLRARNHLYIFTSDALDAATAEIDRAIEIAGPNPLLFATKGLIYWQYFNTGANSDPVMLDRAEELARETLALEPDSARGEMLRGLVCMHRARPLEAMQHLEAALKRDPNDPDATGWLFALRLMTGRESDARPLVDRLAVIDPIGWMTRLSKPLMAMMDGKFEQALEHMANFDERVPFETMVRVMLLMLAGKVAEAEGVADELLRRAPDDPFARISAMLRFGMSGDRQKVEALLTESLVTIARNDLQYSSWMAQVFALLGDARAAAEWMRHAMSRGYIAYPFHAKHDRMLDRVRADPEFEAVLEEMRAAWAAASSRSGL